MLRHFILCLMIVGAAHAQAPTAGPSLEELANTQRAADQADREARLKKPEPPPPPPLPTIAPVSAGPARLVVKRDLRLVAIHGVGRRLRADIAVDGVEYPINVGDTLPDGRVVKSILPTRVVVEKNKSTQEIRLSGAELVEAPALPPGMPPGPGAR